MKYLSSLCLSMPWWYVLYTAQPLTEHGRAFLIVNACATIASMVYRQFGTPLSKQIDQIMITALQIIFHVTSNIPSALVLACISSHRIHYVYVVSTLWYALEGHWFPKLMTLAIGGLCYAKNNEHALYLWTWHFTGGMMCLYPFLFNEFETKVTIL